MKKTFKADSRSSFHPGNGFCRCHLLLFLSKGRTIGMSSLVDSNIFSVHPLPEELFSFPYPCIIGFQYILQPHTFNNFVPYSGQIRAFQLFSV